MATLEGDPDLLSWKDSAGTLHALSADLVVECTDDRTAALTEHPVEKGSPVTDHIRQAPDKIQISIAQTQTPIDAVDGFKPRDLTVTFAPPRRVGLATQGVGLLTDAIGLTSSETSATVQALQADAPVDRVADLHDQLIGIKQNGYPVTVTFKGRTYPDFVITSLKLKHVKGEFGLGRFEIEAQKFRTVSTSTAKLPDPKSLRAKKAKTSGKKGTETKAPDKGQLRSSLRSVIKTFGGE